MGKRHEKKKKKKYKKLDFLQSMICFIYFIFIFFFSLVDCLLDIGRCLAWFKLIEADIITKVFMLY